jgi:hypothetical protein
MKASAICSVRRGLIPYSDLRNASHAPGTAPAIEQVVAVRHEDNRVGVVVDRVPGTDRTIVGGGRVAPIIYTACHAMADGLHTGDGQTG